MFVQFVLRYTSSIYSLLLCSIVDEDNNVIVVPRITVLPADKALLYYRPIILSHTNYNMLSHTTLIVIDDI